MKVLQILYGGLGGHGSVFFSMVEADALHQMQNEAIFVGIEELKPEYAERCEINNIPYSLIRKKPGKHIIFFLRLFNAVRKADTDVVVVHGNVLVIPVWMALLIRRRKIKLVTVMHQAVKLLNKKDWLGVRISLRLAYKTIFLTEEYKAAVEKTSEKTLTKKTAVIPNGIDLTVFKPAGSKKENGEIVLGMQSRMTAIKDHPALLDAFLLLKKALPEKKLTLRIAGDGNTRKAMEEKAALLGIRQDVFFAGMLSEHELPAFIQGLDIYIHATLGETMSTAIMQVMACRLPVIASDVDGVNNMIRNGITGLTVPPQNAEAMAAAVMYLIKNPAEAEKLAVNAFDYAKAHYSNTLMLKRYIAVFTGGEID